LPEQLGPLRTMQAAATDQGSQIRLSSPRRYRSNVRRCADMSNASIGDTLPAPSSLLRCLNATAAQE
jgi:hypothetical protein